MPQIYLHVKSPNFPVQFIVQKISGKIDELANLFLYRKKGAILRPNPVESLKVPLYIGCKRILG